MAKIEVRRAMQVQVACPIDEFDLALRDPQARQFWRTFDMAASLQCPEVRSCRRPGIEIRQTDYPDVLIADIPTQLYAVLESRFTDAAPVFTSGAWDAGDIAYTLGETLGPPCIDGVEWSGVDMFLDGYAVPLPPRGEAPSSSLIATLQIDWVGGASFSSGSDSGNTELLRIGPIFVSRGDEWACVLKATTQDEALREFENDLPDEEGLEKTLFR